MTAADQTQNDPNSRMTNKQTHKQTDAAENIQSSSLCYVVGQSLANSSTNVLSLLWTTASQLYLNVDLSTFYPPSVCGRFGFKLQHTPLSVMYIHYFFLLLNTWPQSTVKMQRQETPSSVGFDSIRFHHHHHHLFVQIDNHIGMIIWHMAAEQLNNLLTHC